MSAAYLRVSATQLGLAGQLGFQRACVAGQFGQEAAELAGHVRDTASASPSRSPSACSAASSVPCQRRDRAASTAVGRRTGPLPSDRRRRPDSAALRDGRGLPQRVEFGQPADVGHQRFVLTRRRVDRVDLVEPELQPVGLLRQLPGPLRCGRPGRGAPPATPRAAARYRASGPPTSANRSSAPRCSSGRISRS